MSNILFLINGLGMGNVVRNMSLIKVIERECNVEVAASGHAFSYIQNNKVNFQYQEFPQLNFHLGLGKDLIEYSFKLKSIIKNVKPDLIILDSVYIPFPIDIPTAVLRNEVKMKVPGSPRMVPSYIIECLDNIYSRIKNKTTLELSFTPKENQFAPILRDEVVKLTSKVTDHAIAFSSGIHPIPENIIKKIQPLLPVKVYHNRGGKVSPDFYNDLASSKFIICRGGFNSLSEALYLKKPTVILPIKYHYEQYQNAKTFDTLGLGKLIESEKDIVISKIEEKLGCWNNELKSSTSLSFKSSETDIWNHLKTL